MKEDWNEDKRQKKEKRKESKILKSDWSWEKWNWFIEKENGEDCGSGKRLVSL